MVTSITGCISANSSWVLRVYDWKIIVCFTKYRTNFAIRWPHIYVAEFEVYVVTTPNINYSDLPYLSLNLCLKVTSLTQTIVI